MNVRNAILRAAPVLAEYGQIDRGILMAWLIRAGLSRDQAHDALRFIPLAFARELLVGMGVVLPDTYVRVTGGEQNERRLDEEPFFREALAMAPQVGAEIGADAFGKIAMASPELLAVNAALNAGVQADGLIASDPIIECDAIAQPRRPWWQFWR
jgi:hypothetical protein